MDPFVELLGPPVATPSALREGVRRAILRELARQRRNGGYREHTSEATPGSSLVVPHLQTTLAARVAIAS